MPMTDMMDLVAIVRCTATASAYETRGDLDAEGYLRVVSPTLANAGQCQVDVSGAGPFLLGT
jgi:hypothetical protein